MNKKKILLLVATDLSDNNSASLCHTAYIRGFCIAGHDVDVISVEPKSKKYNHEIVGVKYHYISDENIIVNTVRKHRSNYTTQTNNSQIPKKSLYIFLKSKLKQILINLFGAMNTFSKRVNQLRIEKEFDLLISLSSPPESHEIANKVFQSQNIKIKTWCQLWEDPWSTDLYNINPQLIKRESNILDKAQKILYVSPLTLDNQKRMFERNAYKMDWVPLPTYYEQNQVNINNDEFVFGYFGQYYPNTRNIQPLYEVLKKLGFRFIICGEPHHLLKNTSTIEIYPRLPPNELQKYENEVNVLVFVANIGGGQIPGKIYQYSGTNKYILFILDGNENEKIVLKKYFEKFNRYYFAENNIISIEKAIYNIINNKNMGIVNKPIDYFCSNNIVNIIIKKIINR